MSNLLTDRKCSTISDNASIVFTHCPFPLLSQSVVAHCCHALSRIATSAKGEQRDDTFRIYWNYFSRPGFLFWFYGKLVVTIWLKQLSFLVYFVFILNKTVFQLSCHLHLYLCLYWVVFLFLLSFSPICP